MIVFENERTIPNHKLHECHGNLEGGIDSEGLNSSRSKKKSKEASSKETYSLFERESFQLQNPIVPNNYHQCLFIFASNDLESSLPMWASLSFTNVFDNELLTEYVCAC